MLKFRHYPDEHKHQTEAARVALICALLRVLAIETLHGDDDERMEAFSIYNELSAWFEGYCDRGLANS